MGHPIQYRSLYCDDEWVGHPKGNIMVRFSPMSVLVAAVLTYIGMTGLPDGAMAGDLVVEVGNPGWKGDDRRRRNNTRDSYDYDRNGHTDDRYRGRDHRYYEEETRYGRYCDARRALRRADEFGVRGARILREGRYGIVVGGYRRGWPIRIRMARERGCPVVSIRR